MDWVKTGTNQTKSDPILRKTFEDPNLRTTTHFARCESDEILKGESEIRSETFGMKICWSLYPLVVLKNLQQLAFKGRSVTKMRLFLGTNAGQARIYRYLLELRYQLSDTG